MTRLAFGRKLFVISLSLFATLTAGHSFATGTIKGQVLGAGAPIANSTVTLWEASAGAPKHLAQTKTNGDGRFEISGPGSGGDTSLYLIATGGVPKSRGGDNPAIALLAILGSKPPATVTINEFTTIASVWTNNQFLNGPSLQGHALGLKIAAGNVPNFVDLQTGGWGTTIQDPLNSVQTPTMANFATLADALATCVMRVQGDSTCGKLFEAAKGPKGNMPTNTLTSAEAIARYPWYQPKRVFDLLEMYSIPVAKTMRAVPYMPYLLWVPSAWVIPLKFTGGGYVAGGKAMFDSEGNL